MNEEEAALFEYDMRPFHVERHTDDGHVILHLTSEVGNFGVDPVQHLSWALGCLRVENDVTVYSYKWEFDEAASDNDEYVHGQVTITTTLEVELNAPSSYPPETGLPAGVQNGDQITDGPDPKHPMQLGVVDTTRIRQEVRLP